MQTESEARREIERENRILQLSPEQLLQIEQETLGAFSVLFHGDKSLAQSQEIYFDWIVDPGWSASPLSVFFESKSDAKKYNSAGSMSAAFDLLAILKLGLSLEIMRF